jgi:integrase/recombinase XerD
MTTSEQVLIPVLLPAKADPLRLAVAAYLAGFKGQSRTHTESDLRAFLTWCQEGALDPLSAQRPHIELYVRWMQEVRRFKPSTVSRRMAVVAGFYRTCVIDDLLAHSPAEHVRRPKVPPESPTLGLTHLQFEAMLTAARLSANVHDFALVAMLGLLGLRIFEACGADIEDLSEEHIARMHPHMLRHTFVTTMLDAGVDLRDVQIAARHADPRTTMRYDRARKTSTATPNTSSPPIWPQGPKRP